MTKENLLFKVNSVAFLGGLDGVSADGSELPVTSQYAANALQRNIIDGLKACGVINISVISLPFLPSYPQAYGSAVYNGIGETVYKNIRLYSPSFLTIRFLRYWSRMFASLRALKISFERQSDTILFVYSVHLPFLLSALLAKRFFGVRHISIYVLDLPIFMGRASGLSKLLCSLETFLTATLLKKFDSVILVSHQLRSQLQISEEKSLVIEGICKSHKITDDRFRRELVESEQIIFLYTGTLDTRYGITDLITAFSECQHSNARLWICGDGNARSFVTRAAGNDSRIKFHGVVDHSESLHLQHAATVLVNPRTPVGSYVKYSFPSKTLEYLAAGKPVIMHALPSVPNEYYQFLYIPKTSDAAGLAQTINDVCNMNISELESLGMAAKNFISKKKSPEHQLKKILNLWCLIESKNAK